LIFSIAFQKDCIPEGFAVIMVFEMGEFVQDDIINDTQRCHTKAIGEIKVILA